MVKGIITAAGLGTRSGLDGKLRKEILPLYDKIDGKLVLRPVLDMAYRRLRYAGCSEVIIILDPGDRMTEIYVESNFKNYVIAYQKEKIGFGNAVYIGTELVGDDDFMLNAGDGIVMDFSYYKALKNSIETTITIFPVENPEKYGNPKIDESGKKVLEVMEKPEKPISKFALAATYYFRNDFKDYLKPSTVELTDSINAYISNGKTVRYNMINHSDWLSIGRKENYYNVITDSFKFSQP